MAFPLLQASLSHFIAERDKCLAKLNVLLNHPVGYLEESITDQINDLFSKLTHADAAIKTVQEIINDNKQSNNNKEQIDQLLTQFKEHITSIPVDNKENPTS